VESRVQTLSTDCADQALAKGVRLWNASWGLENVQTHRLKGSIDGNRVNRVSIVNHESVPQIARHDHPKLLRRPVRRRMLGDVPVQDPSRALSVSNSLSGRDRQLDELPAVGDPAHLPQVFRRDRVFINEGQRRVALQ